MKSKKLPLLNYLLGFSLALLIVSTCFRVQSSSAPPSPIALNHSALEAAATASPSRAVMKNRLSGFATSPSPFAPVITATKSHAPAGSASPGDTLTYTVTIANSGTSDATGVSFSDTIDPNTTLVAGSVKASPIASDDSYHTIGNVNISVPVGQGVVANDMNPNGSGTLTVTQVNATSVPGGGSATATTAHGSVTMSSDGSFTYSPNAGDRAASDSFAYTLDNGTGATDTANVTISLSGMIWFVDNTPGPAGDGRLTSPFRALTGAGSFDASASDAANDVIFIHTGASNYTGGLTLLAGQKVIGKGAGQSIETITGFATPSGSTVLPTTGGTNPTITTSAAGSNGINLGSNNELWGLTFGNRTGAAIAGSGFGTLKVRDTTINGSGQALNLSTGTLDAVFQAISSSASPTTAINLSSVGGTLTSATTSVASPAGTGLQVQNAPAGASLGFGTTSVTASTNTGVRLIDNIGNVAFGSLTITPTANQRGLYATNAVANSGSITTTGGAITTSGAVAVEVNRSSAGTIPLVMALGSVSASGGTNGIILINTSGSFTVDGDGANTTTGGNGSGGTISGMSGADGAVAGSAVYLDNATNVALRRMTINGTNQNFGIRGQRVNGFALEYATVAGTNGTSATFGTYGEGSVYFGNASGATGLTGSATVTGCNISGGRARNFSVVNTSGTLNRLTVTGTTFGLNQNFMDAGQSLAVEARNSGTVANVTVTGSTFTGAPGDLANFTGQSGTTMDVVFQNNTCSNSHAQNLIGGGGITLATNGAMTFNASNNALRDADGSAITLFKANSGTSLNGTVNGNTIGVTGVANSGSKSGNGIFLSCAGGGAVTLAITNNDIRQYAGNSGIYADNNGGSYTVDLTLTGNTVAEGGAGTFAGVVLTAGSSTGDTITVCANVTGNDFSNADPNDALDVYTLVGSSGSFLRLPGLGAAPTEAQIESFILANNNVAGTNVYADVSAPATYATNYVGGAACSMASMSLGPEISSKKPSTAAAPADDTVAASDLNELRAAAGQAPPSDSVQKLRQEELDWAVQAALQRWQQAAIPESDLARLRETAFGLTQLPAGQLASLSAGRVLIDETAAGYGWYFDQTPFEDSEFDVAALERERQTTDLSLAQGRVDLLTVVMRQLGAVYLEGKTRVPKKLRTLMEPTLSPAVRRMPIFYVPDPATSKTAPATRLSPTGSTFAFASTPSKQGAAAIRISPVAPGAQPYAARARRVAYNPSPSGETVNLNVGTIPAGESVTITFQVTINDPLPAGVCSVTNVGHVSGSNFSPVDTNADVTNINKPLTLSACPSNITKNTDAGQCSAVVTYTTPTADGCPAPTVTCTPASGTAFNKGTTTVTCTASNGVSPDASCTFTVTVNDNEAPQITCPANLTRSTDANVCTAAVTYATPTATDNCPGVGAVTCTPASGSTFNKGVTTVNCSVTDASSNSASCSFTVTVNDTQAPTINCPANVVHGTDTDACTAAVTYATPTVSDNCPGVGAPSCSPASGSTFPKGVTTVTCSVTDASGNPASCSFTVTVNDTQAPTIGACPSNISVVSGGACQTVTYATPTASDNCGTATVTCVPASGTCFPNGTTTVTCTASDTSPDSPDSSCSFTVTVVPCTISCPANITVGTNPSQQCGTVVSYPAPTTSGGGCGTVTCSPASGAFFPVGTTMVNCSTQAGPSCGFSVTVFDNTPPALSCAPDQTVLAGTGCQAQVPNFVVSASDNCGGVTVTQTPAAGTIVGPGAYPVHVSVTDSSGNTTTCDKTFTVTNDPPVVVNVTGPSGPITLGSSATVTASYTDTAVQGHTATFSWGDASPNTTVTVSPANSGNVTASHTYTATGVYTVTVTVTDDCGAASAAFAYKFIVVYDPNGGFVTGGGWIQSAAGSYAANPSLSGKANFGFVVRYQNGASVPTGNTEFKFDSMNFKATGFEWLVVSGAKAQFKGSGTINGAGDYRFLVTVTDGNQPGGGGTDKFRIKIWDASTNAVVYDNVWGGSDDINLANPQALGGGSIVIH